MKRQGNRRLFHADVRHAGLVIAGFVVAGVLFAVTPLVGASPLTATPTSGSSSGNATASRRNAAMDAMQTRVDFPRLRQTVSFENVDWESGRHMPRTTEVRDNDPFLEARVLPASPPADPDVHPVVPDYHVAPDLANVINRGDFRRFTADQRAMLENIGFVVTPSDHPQMFYVYEENVYWNLPNFVTTDVMLHTFGDLFAYSLKKVERRVLFGWTLLLSRTMRAASQAQAAAATNDTVRAAALDNAVYFAVAEEILSGRKVTLPRELAATVAAERARIRAADGVQICFTGHEVDYAEFQPRGHYTASADARNYFRAMQWLGQVPFDISRNTAFSKDTLRGQLILLALKNAAIRGANARAIWERIDDLVEMFTASPSTLAPRDWQRVLTAVYGVDATPSDLADPIKQREFVTRLKLEPPASMIKLTSENISPWHMRFLPRRAVLDAKVMQRLVGRDRPHSGALDVMTVLGVDRARELVEAAGFANQPAWYPGRLTELQNEMAAMSPTDWARGVYSGFLWLYAATSTTQATGAATSAPTSGSGMPWFTRSLQWADRCLTAACGSWAELRHHTILYSESYGAEGGGDQYRVNLPKGYVEPNPVFFGRLEWLTAKLRAGLAERGCLTERQDEKFTLFTEMAHHCGEIATKELAWQTLGEDDYKFIHFVGSDLAKITTDCLMNDLEGARALWEQLPEASRNQAMIADIGTGRGKALEIGTGPAQEIYVVVPSLAGPKLTRGAVYEYYEFLQPSDDRLTDAAWQQRLAGSSSRHPGLAAWQEGYRSRSAKPTPMGMQEKVEEGIDFDYIYVPD